MAGKEDLIFKAHIDGVEIAHEDLVFHPEEGPVYTDGSSLHYGTAAEASGCSLIQGKPGGTKWKILVISIGSSWPRSAGFAENLAVMQATTKASRPIEIVTD